MKQIEIKANYSDEYLNNALQILEKYKILLSCKNNNILVSFTNIDKSFFVFTTTNPLVIDIRNKINNIRSFSTKNGKTNYFDYNKNIKVTEKSNKKEKRLGYNYFKKDYSYDNSIIDNRYTNKIICGDSEEIIKNFPDNSIDLIFTSPPYNFGIEYNQHDDTDIWKDYFNKLFLIFDECERVLKSSGRILINVQPMFSDYIPSHHIISNYFFNKGLIWKGEILWEKNNYNCKYCTWGSWKSPSSPYLKYSWEFIEIFCKNDIKKLGEKNLIDINADEFKKWVYAKWSIATERKMKEYKHDAMFPEELANRIIKLFSYERDIVLDPFNGVGTTTLVAKRLNRGYIGIDIDQDYCNIANDRLKNIF